MPRMKTFGCSHLLTAACSRSINKLKDGFVSWSLISDFYHGRLFLFQLSITATISRISGSTQVSGKHIMRLVAWAEIINSIFHLRRRYCCRRQHGCDLYWLCEEWVRLKSWAVEKLGKCWEKIDVQKIILSSSRKVDELRGDQGVSNWKVKLALGCE